MSLQTVGRSVAEKVTENVERVDLFSETSIGACVTCCVSVAIWLFWLPLFHMIAVPWMERWEGSQQITMPEYMKRAEETYAKPKDAYFVLDANDDGNSTMQEFLAGSARFKRPPFQFEENAIPLFHEFDINQDDSIQREEFYAATDANVGTRWHNTLQFVRDSATKKYGTLDKAYKAWDSDGDSKVSPEEFKKGASDTIPDGMSDADVKADFDAADKNKDGVIEPHEWVVFTEHCFFHMKAVMQTVPAEGDQNLNKAMEATIADFFQAAPDDVTTCIVKASQAVSTQKERRLATINLASNCSVDTGTEEKMKSMQGLCQQLPTDAFASKFKATYVAPTTTATTTAAAGASTSAGTPAGQAAPAGAATPEKTAGAAKPAAGPGGAPASTSGSKSAPSGVSTSYLPLPSQKPEAAISADSASDILGVAETTTRSPNVTTTTEAQIVAAVPLGPMSDKELKDYYGKSCIIDGETKVFLEKCSCKTAEADQQIDRLKDEFAAAIKTVTGETAKMQTMQIAQSIYGENNLTVVTKWEIDTDEGGEFHDAVKANGKQFDQSLVNVFKTGDFKKCVEHADVSQHSIFNAQYYHVVIADLSRGPSLEQEFGQKYDGDKRKDMDGSSPYPQP